MVKQLEADGLAANAIHGNKSQGQRERALAEFKDGIAPILVATDIAARGIDVDGITHVVQYDLPEVPETYVHRIGRTARAGASGEAVALVCHEDLDKLFAIEKLIRQVIPAEDQRDDKTRSLAKPGLLAARPARVAAGRAVAMAAAVAVVRRAAATVAARARRGPARARRARASPAGRRARRSRPSRVAATAVGVPRRPRPPRRRGATATASATATSATAPRPS